MFNYTLLHHLTNWSLNNLLFWSTNNTRKENFSYSSNTSFTLLLFLHLLRYLMPMFMLFFYLFGRKHKVFRVYFRFVLFCIHFHSKNLNPLSNCIFCAFYFRYFSCCWWEFVKYFLNGSLSIIIYILIAFYIWRCLKVFIYDYFCISYITALHNFLYDFKLRLLIRK